MSRTEALRKFSVLSLPSRAHPRDRTPPGGRSRFVQIPRGLGGVAYTDTIKARTRLTLYSPAGCLLGGGLSFAFTPALALKLFLAMGDYDLVFLAFLVS